MTRIRVLIEVENAGSKAQCEIVDVGVTDDGSFALGSAIGRAVAGVFHNVAFCDGAEFIDTMNEFLPKEFMLTKEAIDD